MPELEGRLVVLRDVQEGDGERLREIHATSEVAAWWGAPEPGFPESERDGDTTLLTILAGGEVAGFLQFSEEPEADLRHATIDLFVDPARHRQGLGTDALRTVIAHLTGERGHHRVTIDPALDNEPAIACYERVGFRRVGILEAHWRDTHTGEWRDTLLMELVVRRPGARQPRC